MQIAGQTLPGGQGLHITVVEGLGVGVIVVWSICCTMTDTSEMMASLT